MCKITKRLEAFTIVELLIVITIIAIVAVINIVSYNGVSTKATLTTLKSDLANNSNTLKLYAAQYGYYPSTVDGNGCPNAPTADTNYCLKYSAGNSYGSYSGNATTFLLQEVRGTVTYEVTQSTSPTAVYVPFYAWDFTTQGNTGWTTALYNSCSGGSTISWTGTYYDMWSGDDGIRLCYSNSGLTKSVSLVSSEALVVYIDARILNTANQGLAMGVTPSISTGSRYYPDLTRRAIRLGATAATVSTAVLTFEDTSAWWNSGATIVMGRAYMYGVYIGKLSEEASLITYLANKGLAIY